MRQDADMHVEPGLQFSMWLSSFGEPDVWCILNKQVEQLHFGKLGADLAAYERWIRTCAAVDDESTRKHEKDQGEEESDRKGDSCFVRQEIQLSAGGGADENLLK